MALRAHIDTNTLIVGDLNTPLSQIDRSSREKINKEILLLLYTLAQIDMVDRVLHPTARQHTFFSVTHGTFSKIDHVLGHKASLNKFKKIEITPGIIADHNETKLEFNNKRFPRKYSNTWKLNNTLLRNQWVTKVLSKEFIKSPRIHEIQKIPESVGHINGHSKEKIYSHKCLHLKKKQRPLK
jgi:hypothetical protein